ncbi:3'(2'),5'-bisphosphate nucleotidase [Malassezia cuniculi]|uniref:3'(2'),5'-bisphosphate nucleotidase n=1 Tax=Malassezia cuniculi TaxID=948313 RepID=A0AAF0ERC4_9BASI|nr:3'(2'),5'-bisphosphate nucleotidase [Malassezia cuniculi]
MSTYLAKERRVAIEAVQTACTITTRVFESLVTGDTLTKKDKSPVTIGDFSAQAAVNYILGQHFSDSIVGEEDAQDLRVEEGAGMRDQIVALVNDALSARKHIDAPLSADAVLAAIDRGCDTGGTGKRFWALDPIDGTKGFLRGGQYAVCLALVVDGEVELGVMGCPNLPLDKSQPKPADGEIRGQTQGLGVVFVAVKGQGAVQLPLGDGGEETPVHMRDATSFSDAVFCESVEAGHSSLDTNARIAEILGMSKERSVRMDSQAKYASIARGDGDVYLRLPVGDGSYREKIWDHAAGALLVAEAGGRVSDIAGRALDFGRGRTLAANRGVIACQEALHAELARAVAAALTEEGRGALLE